ncbi:MAG: hypothetical protein QOJ46_832 [bacterium]
MSMPTDPALRWRVQRVITELDALGQFDDHAALCLRLAIGAARARTIEMVLVDLRDLTAIDADGLNLLVAESVDCRAHGVDLGLLIDAERCAPIAEALVLAGLGDALHYSFDVRPGSATDRAGPRPRAWGALGRRLVGAVGRLRRGDGRAAPSPCAEAEQASRGAIDGRRRGGRLARWCA